MQGVLTNLLSRLAHLHLLLHLDHLLLLGEGQRPRHTQQQRAGAHHEDGLAAEGKAEPDPAGGRVDGVGDVAARGRRDYVFERSEPVGEGLV